MIRRRRRNPDDVSTPRRRRRGGNRPEAEPERRRRRRGTTDPDTGGEQARSRPSPAEDPGSASAARQAGSTESTAEDASHQPSTSRSSTVATEVTLPQLGESVTEGTITEWLVAVGDHVEADQPLFELSSDKIDTEVPAPASGVLSEIKVGVDETVEVGTVVAVIGGEETQPSGGEAPTAEAPAEETQPSGGEAPTAEAPAEEAPSPEAPAEEAPASQAADSAPQPAAQQQAGTDQPVREPAHEPAGGPRPQAPPRPSQPQEAPSGNGQGQPPLASPLVRRIAADKGVDVSQVRGSGEGGRVTREDIEAATGGGAAAQAPQQQAQAPAAPREPARAGQPTPQAAEGQRERTESISRIRQRIADKMMESLQSSAQLTTVQEVDVTSIMRARARAKDEFKQREGVSLSPFAFLCRAAVMALRHHPRANAQADWQAGTITYRDYVNLGVAVDTEKGLIVPNIKGADDLSLAGLARAVNEAAEKARGRRKLEMHDIEGGTFTMTNTGSVGVLIDTPILNHPEVAILGTGAIKKRPVVIEVDGSDTIAIRHMMYLSLTYDHQLLDGADAARFVTEVKNVVESTDWNAEIGY